MQSLLNNQRARFFRENTENIKRKLVKFNCRPKIKEKFKNKRKIKIIISQLLYKSETQYKKK